MDEERKGEMRGGRGKDGRTENGEMRGGRGRTRERGKIDERSRGEECREEVRKKGEGKKKNSE